MARNELGGLEDLNSERLSQIKEIPIAGHDESGVRGERTREKNIVLGITGTRFPKWRRLDDKRVLLDPGQQPRVIFSSKPRSLAHPTVFSEYGV